MLFCLLLKELESKADQILLEKSEGEKRIYSNRNNINTFEDQKVILPYISLFYREPWKVWTDDQLKISPSFSYQNIKTYLFSLEISEARHRSWIDWRVLWLCTQVHALAWAVGGGGHHQKQDWSYHQVRWCWCLSVCSKVVEDVLIEEFKSSSCCYYYCDWKGSHYTNLSLATV